jgi:PAS domain S-box-containing protein
MYSYPIKGPDGSVVQVIEYARDISKRKELEIALKASEERYRTLVEMAREGIYLLDVEARIVFANEWMASMLGYSQEEIQDRSMFDFVEEEDKEVAGTQLERRRKGLADIYELRLKRKDSTSLICLISVSPLMVDGAFVRVVGILTDITRLKQTEAELQRSRLFSEKIINSIMDNLIVIDPRTYRIVTANRAFLDRVGSNAGFPELEGRRCYEVMLCRNSPCDVEKTCCPVNETFLKKVPSFIDKVYPDAEGRDRILQIAAYPILDESGNVDLIVRLERDVTESRRMEEALAFRSRELEKAQRQLEVLFEISRQVAVKGTVEDVVYLVDKVALDIFRETDSAFFILNAAGDGFLRLEGCSPETAKTLWHLLDEIVHRGATLDLLSFATKADPGRIIGMTDSPSIPASLEILLRGYSTWAILPVVGQNRCIGFFLLASQKTTDYQREDLRFLMAFFSQVAGHLNQLVLYEDEISRLRQQKAEQTSYEGIIGQSNKMKEVYELIELVSASDATVLITGENGTGKELVAQAIHRQSHRRNGPFVIANCSAYSPSLLESELFGHEKGAFTGAIHQKKGRIERAHGGTLFMDEIGEIAPATQILLLRFLQDHCFDRVGGEKTIAADVRVLAATNRDLLQEVRIGRFRDDLYYRLNVISIHLPPLWERKEDIPLLAQHFLRKYCLKEGKNILRFSTNAMQALMDFDWPGNVRQLENAISHAVIVTQGEQISLKHLPRFLKESSHESVSTSLTENERLLIQRVLQECSWNKHAAARRLNVSRSTLYSKTRRYDLDKREKKAETH